MTLQKIEIEVDVPDGWKIKPTTNRLWYQFEAPCSLDVRLEASRVPTYRNVTAADVGREVEISDTGTYWEKRILLAVLPDGFEFRFIVGERSAVNWKYARILDDGQPTPREVYVCETHYGGLGAQAHPSLAEALDQMPAGWKPKLFREVV